MEWKEVYLVCSADGFTEDSKNRETENLQVIDWVRANSEKNALEKIAVEHPALLYGFRNFVVFKLVEGYGMKHLYYSIEEKKGLGI